MVSNVGGGCCCRIVWHAEPLHSAMRKARRAGVRNHDMMSAGGARARNLPSRLAIPCALALLMGAADFRLGGLRAQDLSARVGIEFLSDGRCTVSSEGDGFRSNATYMRPVAGEPAELRCAMPPVPSGRTVALVVSLPTNVRSPGTSVPPLEWVQVQGRWVGTARLTEWPDAVVVSPARGWLAARSVVTSAAAVITAIVGLAIATYIRRSRRIHPPE